MTPFSIGSLNWAGLSKLIEEAGEVSQVAGKIIGAEGADVHFDGTNLRDRLSDEIADLCAAITFVQTVNDLDHIRINRRCEEKLARFFEWHKEGLERG